MSETSTAATTPTPTAPRLREKGRLMSSSEIERTLVRLAHEIVERNNGATNLGLVGIKRRGVPLAERIAKLIGTKDKKPVVEVGEIGFDVNGRDIILMDDVLYTGRTIRAALDALFDHGRPKSVQLLVLIDRGHRELPIEARFIGRTVPTSRREIIEVKLREIDDDEQVILVELVD
jgi:pyrimidine operon attenuation protein/uracil phosphoribosyltransferase